VIVLDVRLVEATLRNAWDLIDALSSIDFAPVSSIDFASEDFSILSYVPDLGDDDAREDTKERVGRVSRYLAIRYLSPDYILEQNRKAMYRSMAVGRLIQLRQDDSDPIEKKERLLRQLIDVHLQVREIEVYRMDPSQPQLSWERWVAIHDWFNEREKEA